MSSETSTHKLQLPSCEHLAQMFSFPKRKSTIPKVPSNLVISDTFNGCRQASDKQQLESYIAESEKNLQDAKNDYETNYGKFLALTHNFYREKLNNLKLTFKNQIVKQQIYFETELIDLSKEYVRDFEAVAPKTTSRNTSKHGKEQHAIKMFREEMKKLTEYMRESLIITSDTLIETFETCEILKRISQAENSSLIQTCGQQDGQSEEIDDELVQIRKYQAETENLMLILDEIELQYLERKNFLHSKKKFIGKLKSKLKSIEDKYENLSKSVNNLKYESYVYKQLWLEKQRLQNEKSASLATKSISRSSSASSLSDTNPNSTSSSSSINCASDYDEELDDLDDLSHDKKDESTYNRKLTIISNLIDLHKAKSSSKDLWHVKNSKSIQDTHSEIVVCEPEPDTLFRQSSSLDLRDCSTDGGKLVVENCSLKLDRDISNWFITRQIDDMSVFKYRLPSGSVIKSGKELRIPTPFRNNELEFLAAIKQKLGENERYSRLKIRTKLISPEGIVKAVHIQEVPQFYHEIFKYASLIQFL
ncbi:hypothetical protein BpHYR1_046213 [Brachionus plicatilis]|uniref:LTD domain-containing protein n=1 Tax=Brachionus plicatilis TaxID=10195 RepID=A0A3M7SN86_BRAPC|nr:hypothetical protein BpHYR1_046213 [Brachionus plicatilis]